MSEFVELEPHVYLNLATITKVEWRHDGLHVWYPGSRAGGEKLEGQISEQVKAMLPDSAAPRPKPTGKIYRAGESSEG